MKRLAIITVGKTHSGKTTFAKTLEQNLPNSVVIDQDNHAEFINTYYRKLLSQDGPNTLKSAISQNIVNYAVNETNYHLILCNANRNRVGRMMLLNRLHQDGFFTVIVYFDIPDSVLNSRIAISQRSKAIFRSASSFEEVLYRQQAESQNDDMSPPAENEADRLFVIKDGSQINSIIDEICRPR
ncbi:AAA domain-containing protein [Paenibacillaceae bacterium GAS479]|nr:AAA domain-containing protein [Paenibacillaceae bacterium GAS479]